MITKEQIFQHIEGWRYAQISATIALTIAHADTLAFGMVSDQSIEQIEQAIAQCRAALDALEATINGVGLHTDDHPYCDDGACPCHAQAV